MAFSESFTVTKICIQLYKSNFTLKLYPWKAPIYLYLKMGNLCVKDAPVRFQIVEVIKSIFEKIISYHGYANLFFAVYFHFRKMLLPKTLNL